MRHDDVNNPVRMTVLSDIEHTEALDPPPGDAILSPQLAQHLGEYLALAVRRPRDVIAFPTSIQPNYSPES